MSLIRPPVRTFINRVAAEETRDGSIIVECELVDSGNGKFRNDFGFDARMVPHPPRNMPRHGYMDIFSGMATEIASNS